MSNIIINPQKLEEAKQWKDVHVVSDFDNTLTLQKVMAILRDGSYLTDDYAQKATRLFEKYRPLEKDSSISKEKKGEIMNEWWGEHYKLLVDSGISMSDLLEIAKSEKIKLRDGAEDFLELLYRKGIPIVIFSACGCGDAVEMILKERGLDYNNIFYIVNRFNWNKEGKAVSPQKPFIHSMNKDETTISSFPDVFDAVKDRRNVVLLGDSLNDADMAKGFDYKNILKIAVLNEDPSEEYREKFDVILRDDLHFLKELFKN